MTQAAPPIMNLLWSYAYARTQNMPTFMSRLAVDRVRFFADSGAHSARTLGIDLQVEDYAKWVKAHESMFTIYANLDVIGAPEATLANQHYLEQEHGLHPMPVFHTGEPWSVLEKYIADGYTYIALGKLLGNTAAALRPWIAKAFKIAGDSAVFHGFGLTNWPMLREFPFYSVDSSSWGSGVRYGVVRLFDRGRWVEIPLRDRAAVAKHRALLSSYRVPLSAMTKKGYDREAVAGACAVAYYRANEYLRNIHGPVALPPGKGYPPLDAKLHPKVVRGTDPQHAYLACTSAVEHHRHGGAVAAIGPMTYLAEGSDIGHRRHSQGVAKEGDSGLNLYLADTSSKWTRKASESIAKERA